MASKTDYKNKSYLTFKIKDEIYAANVAKVTNILEMTKITEVPKAPDYMKGVINLRGTVLPLVDTNKKFGYGETVQTTNTCILVLELSFNTDIIQVGAIVDAVQEVIEIEENQIKDPPTIGDTYNTEFITGMVEKGEDFIMLLDMEKVFTTDELVYLKNAEKTAVTE